MIERPSIKIKKSALPTLAAGSLLAVSMLAGRWGIDRVISLDLGEGPGRAVDWRVLFEVRFWSVFLFDLEVCFG